MTAKNIEKQAMELDATSRAKLANKLLKSLDELSESEIEKLWLEEASRRNEEINKGRAKTVPANEVFKNAHARFKK